MASLSALFTPADPARPATQAWFQQRCSPFWSASARVRFLAPFIDFFFHLVANPPAGDLKGLIFEDVEVFLTCKAIL